MQSLTEIIKEKLVGLTLKQKKEVLLRMREDMPDNKQLSIEIKKIDNAIENSIRKNGAHKKGKQLLFEAAYSNKKEDRKPREKKMVRNVYQELIQSNKKEI